MLVNLECERIRASFSNTELASKLNISKETLKMWIRCQDAIPANKLVELLQIFAGCSSDYLLKRN